MRTEKFLRKMLIASLAAGSFIFTPEIYDLPANAAIAHAEVMKYVGVGESIISDRETIEIGKQGARLQAIRNAQEQAGVFISSYSVMRDHELETDEVIAFTAGILKVSDKIKYEPIPLGDDSGAIKYRATVVVMIDTNDLTAKINEWMKRSQGDRMNLVEQNKELLQIIDDLKRRNNELENLIANATTTQEKAKVQTELNSTEKYTRYAQKIEEGNKLFNAKKYEEALNVYSEAIQIDPDNFVAYIRRARAHSNLIRRFKTVDKDTVEMSVNEFNDFEKALKDLEKASELNPTNADIYHTRGMLYQSYGNAKWQSSFTPEHYADAKLYYYEAIPCYDKAIELDPNFAAAYNNRGLIYERLGEYDRALTDFNTAIRLDPSSDYIYYLNRGITYEAMGDYNKALRDYNKSIERNANFAEAYSERGWLYRNKIKDEKKAKQDFKKSDKLRNNK